MIIVEKIFREDLDDVAAIYNNLGSTYQAIQFGERIPRKGTEDQKKKAFGRNFLEEHRITALI